jgi:putative inorganic carbon (hco3(-)) transporter
VASAIVTWRDALDFVALPKWTVVMVCAVLVAVTQVVRTAQRRRLEVPWDPAVAAAGIFLLVATISALLADERALAIMGARPRYSGLALYAACGLLFLVAARRFAGDAARAVLIALIVGGGVVAGYGVLQLIDADPWVWRRSYSGVESFLGNPNFAAGWLGATLAPVLWGVLNDRWLPGARACGAAVGVAAVVVILGTSSVQGLVNGAAAVAVVMVAWLLDRRGATRRIGLAVCAGVGALGLAGVVAGLAGLGPAAQLAEQRGFVLRRIYWDAAVAILGDRPLTGVGLERFVGFFRHYRPVESVTALDLQTTADNAHSVPLQLAAGGGWPLLLAYGAFVLLVGWRLVVGLRTLEGRSRLLLGGLGGTWVAYQVQSLVSMDIPPLAVLHWVVAGAVLPATRPLPVRTLALGAAPTPPRSKAARHKRDRIAVAAVAVLALPGLWAVTIPVRADIASQTGARAVARGDLDGFADLERATRLAPWDHAYWFERGRAHSRRSDNEEALAAYLTAYERSGGSYAAAVSAARFAHQLGRPAEAARLWGLALAAEPHHPDLKVMAAEYHAEHGDRATAVELVDAALAIAPDHAGARELRDELGPA